MICDYQFRNYNFRALIYMILLSVLGILVVGSASNQDRSSVIKQIMGVVVSLIICLVLSLIDYHQYFRDSDPAVRVCKDRSDPHPGEFSFQKPGENQ